MKIKLKVIGKLYVCPYCRKKFMAKRKDNQTCGKKECIGKYKVKAAARWRKKHRRTSIYADYF